MGGLRPIADIQPFAELHQGAIATVYKGYQRSAARFVLLKVLRDEVAQDEALAERFADEARLVGRIDHPNVVPVYAAGQDEDGTTYLAAEFVEGLDLAVLLEHGRVPPEVAAHIVEQVARGLEAAHAAGVVHRDLKPSNILLGHDGAVKLTDFGMASLMASDEAEGEVRGTPAYLAPEHLQGAPPAPQGDLFALGATFYELLTGRPAFRGGTPSEIINAVLQHDPLPYLEADTRVPRELRRIVRRLMAKQPADRYADVAALRADLEAFRTVHPEAALDAATLAAYLEAPDAYEAVDWKPVDDEALLALAAAAARDRAASPPPGAAASDDGGPARPRRRWGAVLAVFIALLFGVAYGGSVWLGDSQPEAPASTRGGTGPAIAEAEIDTLAAPAPVSVAPPDTTEALATDLSAPPDSSEVAASGVPLAEPESPGPGPPDRTSGLTPGRRLPVENPEAPPAAGTLAVACVPWAAVYVDGDSLGTTPLGAPVSLAPGTYSVALRNPDFPPYTTTVTIEPGESEAISVSLWSLVGRVQVEVNPWAEVYVDGRYHDTTPFDQPLIVSPGVHEIELRHPALGRWEGTFRVEAGQQRTLQYNLRELLGP